MTALLANNAVSELAVAITATATTIVVTSGKGALFPAPSVDEWFPVTLQEEDSVEIVYCTARTGDSLTVERGKEGTTALAFSTAALVELRYTAGVFSEVIQRSEKATTAEAQAGAADKFPDAAGVHAAFNQYGLGTDPRFVTYDLDTLRASGRYAYSFQSTNTPASGTSGAVEVELYGNEGRVVQRAHGTANAYYATRYAPPGQPFTSWAIMFHIGNILGTVSQSAGVPTGAIIERGSNANGEWTKFADGTLILTSTNSAFTVDSTADEILSYTTSHVGLSPAFCVVTITPTVTNSYVARKLQGRFLYGDTVEARINVDNPQDYLLSYLVIGRWY